MKRYETRKYSRVQVVIAYEFRSPCAKMRYTECNENGREPNTKYARESAHQACQEKGDQETRHEITN